MAQEASRKKIQKFKQDVDFLVSKGITQDAIADKMKMAPENFNAYYNEKVTITNPFVGKFYDAWGSEVLADDEESLAADLPEIYRIHDTIVEKLVDGQNKLIDSNIALVDYNQKLMAILIERFIPPPPPPKSQPKGN